MADTVEAANTVEPEDPPPWWNDEFHRRADAIEMSLRSVWACQVQIHRFADGFAGRPTVAWDYSKGIVAPVDKIRQVQLYRVDGYLVAVLAKQVIDWLERVEKELGPDAGFQLNPEMAAHVAVLRDIYEHWSEHSESFRLKTPKNKAGGRFVKHNPNLAMPGDGWKVDVVEGPFLDNLRLNDLFAELRRVEDMLLQAQRDEFASVGLTVPNGGYKPMRPWYFFPETDESLRGEVTLPIPGAPLG